MATADFLVEVLKGEKRALHTFEVKGVNVPINKYTSKEQLSKMIKASQQLMQYFPDDPLHQCDRQYMLDIINTLDPEFFGRVMHEYDVFQHSIAKEDKKVIAIDHDLYEVLNRLTNTFESKTAKCHSNKFHLPLQKRKKPQKREMPEMQTTFNGEQSPFVQQKRRYKYF